MQPVCCLNSDSNDQKITMTGYGGVEELARAPLVPLPEKPRPVQVELAGGSGSSNPRCSKLTPLSDSSTTGRTLSQSQQSSSHSCADSLNSQNKRRAFYTYPFGQRFPSRYLKSQKKTAQHCLSATPAGSSLPPPLRSVAALRPPLAHRKAGWTGLLTKGPGGSPG